ncbi:hypothetical protein DF182_09285 [Chitinophaga flava]|uniref:Lipocalin-like domain-containing protein n=2 Tax=Chitinophaga flava TaxID=2259036 RepID=A0A365Y394_9BACT|nr:hypothetical protein DF182_09285 [Chitinophaga flava]
MWQGHYELSTSRDEIMNDMQVGTFYELNINSDSCLFTANGIQYAFSNMCSLSEKNDTLTGYYAYDTRGFQLYKQINTPLFKIFKKADQYYIISSAILEDTSKSYVLKRTL